MLVVKFHVILIKGGLVEEDEPRYIVTIILRNYTCLLNFHEVLKYKVRTPQTKMINHNKQPLFQFAYLN